MLPPPPVEQPVDEPSDHRFRNHPSHAITCDAVPAASRQYGEPNASQIQFSSGQASCRDLLSLPLVRVLFVRMLKLDSAVVSMHDDLAELGGLGLFLRVADCIDLVLEQRSRLAAAFRFDAPLTVTGRGNVEYLACHVRTSYLLKLRQEIRNSNAVEFTRAPIDGSRSRPSMK